ncbi:MAG: HlyD family type I secretion periplasmic adaptor subunit [Hyphomicrobiaceae bacterium]
MDKPASTRPAATQSVAQTLRSLRLYQLGGTLSILAVMGGLGGWAAITEISGAVMAPGSVVVEGNSKKVQHLEGGIVAALYVRNIDQVKAGQPLLQLDDTEIRASLQITQAQIEELKARQARLLAERDGRDKLALPDIAPAPQSQKAVVWLGQAKLFESRRGARADKEKQLLDRVTQLQEVIKGLGAQLKAKDQQAGFIREELDGLLQLQEQQLVAKPRVLTQQRERSRIEGERGQLISEIARTNAQISETRLQLTEARQAFSSEVLTELRDVETKLAELNERDAAISAKLRRLVVLAPISGVIHKLSVVTLGGVVAAGETLMEIVPNEEALLVEGQLDPGSIDQVKKGQEVYIRFTALDQRVTPELQGRVVSISADVRQDSPQFPRYYAIRAILNESELEKLGTSRLVPGMPAEMMIRRGERTVLAYLVKPFADQLAHAFRER